MLPQGIISRFRLAVALISIAGLALSAGTSLADRSVQSRGSSNRGNTQTSRQDKVAAEAKFSGRQSPAARQETPRVEMPRQTQSYGSVHGTRNLPVGNSQQRSTIGRTETGRTFPVGTNHQPPTVGRTETGRTFPVGTNHQQPTVGRTETDRKFPVGTNHQQSTVGRTETDRKLPVGQGRNPGTFEHKSTPGGQPQYTKPDVRPDKQSRPPDDRRKGDDRQRDEKARTTPPIQRPVTWGDVYQPPKSKKGPEPKHTGNYASYQPKGYRPPVHVNGYYHYPTYRPNKPLHYGHWVFDGYDPHFCRKSVYFHFGYFPYVRTTRIYVDSYITISYRSGPVVIGGTYYLSRNWGAAVEYAMADIRYAWTEGRFDLIRKHVRSGDRIAVLLDGRYDYSMDGSDYLEMTEDAIDQIDTMGFTWTAVRQRTDGQYTVFGKHTYRDQSSLFRTTYVSYTLDTYGGSSYITEVGSSDSPLH